MTELKDKVEGYLKKAGPRFEGLEDSNPTAVDLAALRREFREMALAYYKDARHFYSRGEYVNALASLEYAEGWLDAGRKLGFFR